MNYYKFNVVFVFTIKGTKEEVQTAEKQFISGVYTPECLRETHHSRDKPEPQKRKIESNDSQDKPKSKKAKIQSKDILDKSKQKKTQKVKGKENKPPKTSNISTIKILSVSELSLPPSPSIPQTSNPAVPPASNPAVPPAPRPQAPNPAVPPVPPCCSIVNMSPVNEPFPAIITSSYDIEIPTLPPPVTPTPAKHSEDYDFIMAQTDNNYFETSCDKDSLITGNE